MKHRKRPYFEGWYFKHQRGGQAIAFIPGIHRTAAGARRAFIQVITGGGTWFVPYPYETFFKRENPLEIRVGDSVFSARGIAVQMDTPELTCNGTVEYGQLLPIRGDIMGYFAPIPGLQCRHGVVSLYHKLRGEITLNGERLELTGGQGYVESDRGRSFPRQYTWFHSNDFPGETPVSVMAAVAHVPLGPMAIQGVIASVYVDGREHRLATYHGGRAVRCTEREMILTQGRDCLTIRVEPGDGLPLYAPDLGEMTRIIRERITCRATVTYRRGDQVLLDEVSECASFERSGYGD